MSIGLIMAAANNKVYEVYQRLVEGENANFIENCFGETALNKATICKHGEVMNLLLYFGASPDIPNYKGFTANDYYNGSFHNYVDQNYTQEQVAYATKIQGNEGYFNPYGSDF